MLKRPGMQGGYPGMAKRPKMDRKFSDKIGFRVLLPSKMAGCLIGKGGSTINKLRETYDCSVRIPDCPGPERILEIVGKEWNNAFECLEAAIPYLYECPDGSDNGDPREMRFLIHQAIAGAIIGKGGENIKEIRESTGVQIKVYSSPCPMSTDRCVQVEGTLDQVMNAAREVYKTVMEHNLRANESIYDPENFDPFFSNEYGGFGSARGPKGGRGGPPMGRGGPRGMGMGRGAFMPPGGFGRGGGFQDDYFDGPARRGFGGMRGGFGHFGGPSGFGNGGSYDAFGGGNRNGVCPKLEFEEDESGTFKTLIEKDLAGAIIGIGGQRIRKIRSDSGAQINISNPEEDHRTITVSGDQESTEKAKHMLQRAVNEFGSGGM